MNLTDFLGTMDLDGPDRFDQLTTFTTTAEALHCPKGVQDCTRDAAKTRSGMRLYMQRSIFGRTVSVGGIHFRRDLCKPTVK